MSNKAVFFDRDGTLIEEIDYKDGSNHIAARKPEDVHYVSGIESLTALTDYILIIVTNQSGIARKLYDRKTLDNIHKRIKCELNKKGIKISGVYYCPHKEDAGCVCRKPKTYKVLEAAENHDIDLKRSFFVGNNISDVMCGLASGCQTVLITTDKVFTDKFFVAKDLIEAVAVILAHDSQ